jgi:class 3 adenylate cyclase
VVRAYQDTCARVIARYEGHIAQYLGDGLLVYFGYPLAHEDDGPRAARAGLGMLEAMGQLNTRLAQERGVSLAVPAGAGGPALHGGGLHRAGGTLLGAGGPTRQRALGPSGSRQPLHHRD